MTLLSVAGLAKSYGAAAALSDASLDLEAGEVHALVGENGAGKSTLIKILAGAIKPDAGAIAIDGAPVSIGGAAEAFRLGLRFIHQELNVLPRMSVAENLFLGRAYPSRFVGLIDWRALRRRAKAALAALGVDDISPGAILGRLAPGDRMIVKIASTFVDEEEAPGRIFVMDEPTAALQGEESERLFRIIGALKARGCGIVYVSHRIEEVLRIADRVTVLRDGVSSAPIASGETSRAALIERMTGRSGLDRAPLRRRVTSGRAAFEVEGLAADGLGPLSFSVSQGEIFGFAGLEDGGGGRVLRTLAGGPRKGAVRLAGRSILARGPDAAWRSGFAYVPRERRTEGLCLSHDIARNVALPHLGRLARLGAMADSPAEEAEAVELGRQVRLRATGPRQRVWRLSGGNQQKVMFARAVAGAPRVLLLDEPTRGVDIAAKFDIHALLRQIAGSGAVVLISSSDHEELVALCDRIAIMTRGRLSKIVAAAGLSPGSLLELCYGEPR